MRIVVEPWGRRITLDAPQSLLRVLQDARVPIETVCSGKGVCGKCRVLILEGSVPPHDSLRKHLTEKEISKGMRLACQVRVTGDMRIIVPEEHFTTGEKILEDGVRRRVPLSGNVEKHHVTLPQPSLADARSTLARLLAEIGGVRIDEMAVDAARSLSLHARQGASSLTAVTIGRRLVDVEEGDTTGMKYGVAVDVGTTTLVAYLVDLTTGERITVASALNPQRAYGEDVMARVQYASSPDGLQTLQACIVKALARLTGELARKAGVEERHIYEMTVVGNTCMHHLLCGISPASLSSAPYAPSMTQGLDTGIPGIPVRNVHLLPLITGFCGADTVGCLIASPLTRKIRLMLDIGTNCEIVLGTRERVFACSAAAGPAFEGAHISCGMRASSGAITGVRMDGEVSVETLDGSSPRGIAGSGLVSALSAMLESGIITPSGRIVRGHAFDERVRGEGKEREFVLVKEMEGQKKIFITQKDVREVQLAKAALFAAQRILARKYGCAFDEVFSLELAGAFGSSLPIEAARKIGMIPNIPKDRVKSLGNAAGVGALLSLISTRERKKASRIAQEITYVELAGRRDFKREFVSAMYFPHSNPRLFQKGGSGA